MTIRGLASTPPLVKKCALALCLSLWAGPFTAAQSDLAALTRDLSGGFEFERFENGGSALLSGAAAARTAVFRSGRVASDGTRKRLRYTDARYADQAVADIDFEKMLQAFAAGSAPTDEWNIVVQAQGATHWLQAACAPSDAPGNDNFRQAYANLVNHAERHEARARRGILCACGSTCKTVAIDR